jgi:hypothetical protein
MDKHTLRTIMEPLAKYTRSSLDEDTFEIYHKRFQNVPIGIMTRAVEILIDEAETHTFPLLPKCWAAVMQAKRAIQGRDGEGHDMSFCHDCRNSGFVLAGNEAKPCSCDRGRMRKAALMVPDEASQREAAEIISRALKTLPPADSPHRGKMEWNNAGFWELTQEEHDKWMAAKRAEIAEIDARRGRKKKMDSGEGAFAAVVAETIEKLGPGEQREPGWDAEDNVPF